MKSNLVAWTLLAASILVSTAVVPQVANPAGPVGIPGPNKQPNPSGISQIPSSVGVGFQGNWEAYAGGFQNGTHYLIPLPHESSVPSQKRAVEPLEVNPAEVAPKPATPNSNDSPGTSESTTSDPNNPSAPIQVTPSKPDTSNLSGPIQVKPDGKPDSSSGRSGAGTSSGDDNTRCKRSADGRLSKRCPGSNGDGDEDAGQSAPNPENLRPAPDRKDVENWITDVAQAKPPYQFKAKESREQRIRDNADDKPVPGMDELKMRNYVYDRTDNIDLTQYVDTRKVAEMIRTELKIDFNPSGVEYAMKNKDGFDDDPSQIAVNSYSKDGKIIFHTQASKIADANSGKPGVELKNSEFTIQQHREVTKDLPGGMNNLRVIARAIIINDETLATIKTAFELKNMNWDKPVTFDATAAPGTDDYIICEALLRSDNGNADLWALGDAQKSYQGRGVKSITAQIDEEGTGAHLAYVLEDVKATGAHT